MVKCISTGHPNRNRQYRKVNYPVKRPLSLLDALEYRMGLVHYPYIKPLYHILVSFFISGC